MTKRDPLKKLLEERDKFIVSKGLWNEFVNTLQPVPQKESSIEKLQRAKLKAEAERDRWIKKASKDLATATDRVMAAEAESCRLQNENDKLRAIIASHDFKCIYCGLPKQEMHKCAHGFPGCGRADDIMLAGFPLKELDPQKEI